MTAETQEKEASIHQATKYKLASIKQPITKLASIKQPKYNSHQSSNQVQRSINQS